MTAMTTYHITVKTVTSGFPIARFHRDAPTRYAAYLQVPAVFRADKRLTVHLARLYGPSTAHYTDFALLGPERN